MQLKCGFMPANVGPNSKELSTLFLQSEHVVQHITANLVILF